MSPWLIPRLRRLYQRCSAEGGVLVVQPEHVLSQNLMHINFLLTPDGNAEKQSVAHGLRALQDWVNSVSRDVLDIRILDSVISVTYLRSFSTMLLEGGYPIYRWAFFHQ